MERITKALEKAQLDRQRISGNSANIDKLWDDDRSSTTNYSTTKKIEYSQSQHFKVSQSVLSQNKIIAGMEDPRADLFKILRTKVIQRMRANKWNLLAVTSPKKGAGKSLTATNLAISIAMDSNYSVLLVDLDLRSPSINQYLGLPEERGVKDFFLGEATIPELLIHPGLENLVVLPAGGIMKRSSDLLTSPKMTELARELKFRYPDRIVIVDLPPILQVDDALAFMPNVDSCILVVSEGDNTAEDVNNSIAMIDEEKYMGCILNKSHERNSTNELAYY